MKTRSVRSAMNLKPVGTVACILSLLAATTLRAQTNGNPPPPPPPPPPSQSYPSNGSVITEGTTNLVADITLPYAFNFNNVGVVGDVGGLWQHNFVGAEVSYYDAQPNRRDYYYVGSGYGWHHYDEQITTVNLAYKLYIPIAMPGLSGAPALFYIGGGAGAGWIQVNSGFYPGFGPNYYHTGNARFDADGVAGFQWNFTRMVGVKLGYRYIWLNNGHLYYTSKRLDSSAVEASLAFHF